MKKANRFFALLLSLTWLTHTTAHGQMVQDPTDWKFSVKKKDAAHYTLTASTTIKATWHIYAINPGGEGELIGTSIQLDPGEVKAVGEAQEVIPAKQENILGENVNLHSGKAAFSIGIAGKKGQTISGTVEYQACNNMMCLPPKKKKFSVQLP